MAVRSGSSISDTGHGSGESRQCSNASLRACCRSGACLHCALQYSNPRVSVRPPSSACRFPIWLVRLAGPVLALAVATAPAGGGDARFLLLAPRQRARPHPEHGDGHGPGPAGLRLGRHPGRPAPLRRPALPALPRTTRATPTACPTATSPRWHSTAADALWVGTYSEYLSRLDLGNGQIRRYAASARQPPAPPGAWRCCRYQRPAVGRHRGRAGATRPGQRHAQDRAVAGVAAAPARPRGRALLATRDGTAWYAGPLGLYRIDPARHAAAHRPERAGAVAAAGPGRATVARPPRRPVPAAQQRPRAGARLADERRRRRRSDHGAARSCRRPTDSCGCRSTAYGLRRFDPASGTQRGRARGARHRGQPARRRGQRAAGRSRRHAVGRRPVPRRRGRRSARHALPLRLQPRTVAHRSARPRPTASARSRRARTARSGSAPTMPTCCATSRRRTASTTSPR